MLERVCGDEPFRGLNQMVAAVRIDDVPVKAARPISPKMCSIGTVRAPVHDGVRRLVRRVNPTLNRKPYPSAYIKGGRCRNPHIITHPAESERLARFAGCEHEPARWHAVIDTDLIECVILGPPPANQASSRCPAIGRGR